MFDEENPKCIVNLSITNYGQEHRFRGAFDDDVVWPEVLDKIVKTLEASYGYTFDIEDLGVYYSGKESNE